MTEYTIQSFRPLLTKLVQTPEYFSPADLKDALNHLFTPYLLLPSQIGAFLTALHIHRVERRPDSLAAAASVLRERALKADVQDAEGDFIVDIVGTGCDGYNLFNVSTTAAIVAAGAGARVIKVCSSLFRNFYLADCSCSTARAHRHPPPALQISSSRSTAALQRRPQGQRHRSRASPSPSSSHRTTTPRSPRSHRTAKR